jgi:hypothetical protein
MSKIYKNDYGHDLRVSVGKDLTDVVETKLLVKKPNGLTTEWSTTVASPATAGVLSHIVTSTDLNMSGQFSIQAYVRYATTAFKGETAKFKVWEKFE